MSRNRKNRYNYKDDVKNIIDQTDENIEENPLELEEKTKGEIVNEIIEEECIIEEKLPKIEEPVRKFKFDGEIKPGLFEKLLDADLDEEEEKFWVDEFCKKGLGIRLEGKRSKDYIFAEKIVRNGADFNETWDIYRKWKDFPRKL